LPPFGLTVGRITVKIIKSGINPAGTKDYQVRADDKGYQELWLYKRGALWAKKFYAPGEGKTIQKTIDDFFAGKLVYSPLSMRGLGEPPK
jgi:hypothetical protein